MAAEPFNSLGGISVGIPAKSVVDANGNVVTNVFTTGNVTAAVVYADTYRYANGQTLTINASGSNTQVQFNSNGNFAASAALTFDSTQSLLTVTNLAVDSSADLGNVANITIQGGQNGYVLQTDGLGNLSWVIQSGGGGNGNPGGANTQIQFNDSGVFGGEPGFTYNKLTNTLTVENITAGNSSDDTVNVSGSMTVDANITAGDTISSANLIYTDGNVVGEYFIGNGFYLSGIVTELANYVVQSDQSNITSVGTLTQLLVSGNIVTASTLSASNVQTGGTVTAGNVKINTLANVAGQLRVAGNVNLSSSPDINMGAISNIHVSGGLNGYVLQTDGLGNLSWVSQSGGGGGNANPGGSNTQIQYNDGGLFGASPFFTFNEASTTVTIAGNLIANVLVMGSGVNKFSTQQVFMATTTSNVPFQRIMEIEAETLSGADFVIVTTDQAGSRRQITKLSLVVYGSNISYNETSTLVIPDVTGFIGDYVLGYDSGNVIIPAQVVLYFTPLPNVGPIITTKVLVNAYDS